MLPTTITSNGKTFTLNPRLYPDLNRSEAIFLARFAMLTKDGAKPCYHTDKEVMECFNISRPTASRLFNKLLKLGYIRVTKTSSPSGVTIRTVEVDPIKIKQTVPAMAKQAAQSAEQAETAQDLTPEHVEPMPAVSAQRPAVPSPTAPKALNPDIAAAMTCPIAGAQPLVKPEDLDKHRTKLWDLAWGSCQQGCQISLINLCNDLSKGAYSTAREQGERIDPCLFLLDKLENCRPAGRTAEQIAQSIFVYHLTIKFLQYHMQCPETEGSIRYLLQVEARDFIESIRKAAADGQKNLAALIMDGLEFPEELKTDPQMTELFDTHLVPALLRTGNNFNNEIYEFLGPICGIHFPKNRAVNAIEEPQIIEGWDDFRYPIRRMRELLSYAPAQGVDPRSLPCYQPFVNTTVFDLGPALDQTKFGRFACYDADGNLHDFKFDFTQLHELLAGLTFDDITTRDLDPSDPRYKTRYDYAPFMHKTMSDFIIFSLVTELIAPITAENVFYNMQAHQDGKLIDLFQDPWAHQSLLMFASDVLNPPEDDDDFASHPIYNYIKTHYNYGSKSKVDFAAHVVANSVVRALGDKEQSVQIIMAIFMEMRRWGRAGWLDTLRNNGYNKFSGVYPLDLRTFLNPCMDGSRFVPRLTYPFMLMRLLFGIRHINPEIRLRMGDIVVYHLDTDLVAQRDLSVLKSTYAADYPFLNKL